MKYTKEQIDAWKVQHGRVLKVTINGLEFLYRPLTLAELRRLRAEESAFIEKLKKESLSQEEVTARTFEYSSLMLCKTCILYPESFDFDKNASGLIDSLQPLIMSASGYPEEPPQPEEL